MPDEMNVSGNETAIENSDVLTENSDNQGTVKPGTETDTQTNDNSNDSEFDSETNDEGDGSNVQNADSDDSSASAAEDDDEPFLTADDGNVIHRSQAESFAKMGYEYQTIHKPIIDKIESIVANALKEDGSSYGSADEFLDTMITAIDENLRQQCLEDAHGNQAVADELFNLRKSERDKNFNALKEQREKAQQEKRDDKSRQIADDFLRLQKKFPEIKSYGDLPKEVKTYAAKNNVSLLEAKLVIDHDNRLASEKAKADAQSAASSSTGSQSGEGDSTDSVIEAMLRGSRY